jgi:hypothetical protein
MQNLEKHNKVAGVVNKNNISINIRLGWVGVTDSCKLPILLFYRRNQ